MSIIEKAVQRAGIGSDDPRSSELGGAIANRQRVARRSSMEQATYVRGFKDNVKEVALSQERLNASRIHYGNGDRVEQEFKRIKRPLISNIAAKSKSASGLGANLIAVTSAFEGEGKTYSSINLALALSSEHDYEVLLIDGDTVRGGATKALGLEKEKGLVDYVRDRESGAPNIVKLNGFNLYVLPAGQGNYLTDNEISSKMARNKMTSLLKPSTRIVIIDCPPLLAAAEATSIVEMAGQVLMVTEAAKTGRGDLDRAIEHIDKQKPVGLVLNKASAAGRNNYGNYYGTKN